MYSNKFVVVIKSRGKVLRERNGVVYLPFGSEYSIILKNLNSVKAVAKIHVDGDDVLDGSRVIIDANDTLELRGKMKGDKVRHHFKFIEKTNQISKHRGNKPDDGLVRVEYWFEKEEPCYFPMYKIEDRWDRWLPDPSPRNDYWGGHSTLYTWHSNNSIGGNTYSNSSSLTSKNKSSEVSCDYYCFCDSTPCGNEDGITVQGSKTKQDFRYGCTRSLETHSSVIVLQLKGNTNNKLVSRPVGVNTRLVCSTCGKRCKSSARWCSRCGTNLEIE
jgi:hypothetical protein